ncbi:MAG: 5-(carboxyamino)imidazole ribonucleotide mutase [Filifactoraceae bacterium]
MKVSIIIGSVSDFDKVKSACDFLKEMEVDFDLRALSAHRTSEELESYIGKVEIEVDLFIAAAGKAAHLPGVIASKTLKPVIGIPIKSSATEGMDALLSIVQMPPGVPVATVAIDGAKNAAILACQILALKYDCVEAKMRSFKNSMKNETINNDKILRDKIKNEYSLEV